MCPVNQFSNNPIVQSRGVTFFLNDSTVETTLKLGHVLMDFTHTHITHTLHTRTHSTHTDARTHARTHTHTHVGLRHAHALTLWTHTHTGTYTLTHTHTHTHTEVKIQSLFSTKWVLFKNCHVSIQMLSLTSNPCNQGATPKQIIYGYIDYYM